MPMEKPEDYGTNADGSKNEDCCQFCFQNSRFTTPDITMEQMIDMVTGIMVNQMKMPETQAREITKTSIPQLKRWRNK